jgi:hypothetical protein
MNKSVQIIVEVEEEKVWVIAKIVYNLLLAWICIGRLDK